MQGTYANAPLLEAICELRFVPGAPWDWTIPGVLYERVKGEFPSKRTRGSVQVGVEIVTFARPKEGCRTAGYRRTPACPCC